MFRNMSKVFTGGNFDELDYLLQKCRHRMRRCQGVAVVERPCLCLNVDLPAFGGSLEEITPVSASLMDEKQSCAALYGQE